MNHAQTLTRRGWLALAAVSSIVAKPFTRPDLGAELNLLWDRALGFKARNPSSAILVSSIGIGTIPALRGWRDEAFLNAYLEWADRPEAAGFDGRTVTADLGPYDCILLRASLDAVTSTTPRQADPIGFTLLKPGPGRHRLNLAIAPNAPSVLQKLSRLSFSALPNINAAVAQSPTIVTLYGTGLEGKSIVIASSAGRGTILYASPNQVNVDVPSVDRVQLTVDGVASGWVTVSKP